MRKSKSYSLGIGFVIFLTCIATFHFFFTFEYFYFNEELKHYFYNLRLLLLFIGILFFTFFAELENNYHNKISNKKKQKFSCPLTAISIIGVFIILFLPYRYDIKSIVLFIFISIQFAIIGFKFMIKFNKLEVIKRTKQLPWFIVGLIMIMLSCLFNSSYMLTNYRENSFYLGTLLIVIGPILTNKGWSRIPLLSELDWITRLDKILIIERKTSMLIYLYSFHESEEIVRENLIKNHVTGSVMGGLNQLLEKILDVKGHIKSLEYGDKRLYFSQGISSICVLIATGFSNEFPYRLEMFHVSFEKAFVKYLGKHWKGELKVFEKTEKLIFDHFIK